MKNYRLCLVFILTIIISILYMSNTVLADQPIKSMTVVMDDNYPPYSFRDSNGNLQGITVDQWKLFEEKTGIKIHISGMEWNKALQSMKDGKFDVIDTISYNQERDKIFDFTKPYAIIDVPIFFYKNISGITDAESLKGFTVAAKKSDNSINVLQKSGITDIQVYDSAEEVVKAARDQKIVVFVLGKPPALYFMYKMGIEDKFNYANSLYTSEFYRAVNEGNSALLNTMNTGFSKITAKEHSTIEHKWFGSTNPSIYDSALFKIIALMILISIFIACVLFLWNRMLQLNVKQKTMALYKSIEELAASEERGRALLEAIPDMFFLFDKEGKIIDYHTIEVDKLYVPPDQLINKKMNELFPMPLAERFLAAINYVFESGKIQTVEYFLEKENKVFYYEARLVSCGKDKVIGIVRDITERKKSEEKLYEISIHDSLTGLFNRYYFENEIVRLHEEKMKSLYIAMFDLDGLKLINDTLGHGIGDQYLISTARIIENAFPKESIISRIGGDEFCIIILDKTKEEIQNYLKRVNDEIDKYNQNSHLISLSVSFGYVYLEQENIDVHEMIKEADNRMYREKLHRRQSMKSEVVQTMKNMLEARDFITEGHASRMENLAAGLSAAVGVAEKDIGDIRLLAQFHDIGKVGIPDHILFKPSKLTNEEFEIMKRHTEIGHRIAESSIDLLPIAEFILKHHEYWDGKGYPFGLKGMEIPLECRILTIVDAYDAMTNDRPYRAALSKEAALEELKRCSGTQFDPMLVKAFIKMMEENIL